MNFSTFLAILLAIVTLYSGSTHAQASAAASTSAISPKPAERIDEIAILPGQLGYTPELAKAGIQGTVMLMAVANEKGQLEQVTIKESSGSKELDSVALALIPRLSVNLETPGTGGRALLVPVEFRKDSVSNISKKTCADFNIDLAYWSTLHADAHKTLPVLNLTIGILALSGKNGDAMTIAKKSGFIIKETIARCAQQPEKLFLEVATSTISAGK